MSSMNILVDEVSQLGQILDKVSKPFYDCYQWKLWEDKHTVELELLENSPISWFASTML